MSSDSKWNARPGWFKSRYSGGANNCVEVNLGHGQEVGLRDSKDDGGGPVLVLSKAAYRSFIGAVQAGAFTNR